jgi:hypothetical protein
MVTAPKAEIGYANASAGWWTYDDTETTPELRWPNSVYVYDQMRRQDAQVASVLRAVSLPVRRTPWRIDPAGAKARVTQFIADELGLPVVGKEPKAAPRTRDRFSWPDHLREALLMLPFGFMFFEQVYRVDPGGARAHLRKLAPRMPRTIDNVNVAPDGGLISITQCAPVGGTAPRPIPVDRLVAYVHEKEGGNWLGSSLLRPAYKHWLIKDRLLTSIGSSRTGCCASTLRPSSATAWASRCTRAPRARLTSRRAWRWRRRGGRASRPARPSRTAPRCGCWASRVTCRSGSARSGITTSRSAGLSWRTS